MLNILTWPKLLLLNNALAGVQNLAGDRFFYVNPLEKSDGIKLFNHGNAGRAPWFGLCICCPSNIARIMPQVGVGHMYATSDDDIYCLLYSSNSVRINLAKRKIHLSQETEYPFTWTQKINSIS